MEPTADAVTVALTGNLPFVLGLAALASFPISFFALRRYRRSVLNAMARRSQGSARPPVTPIDVTLEAAAGKLELEIVDLDETSCGLAAAGSLVARAQEGPWRLGRVYVVAGLLFGLTAAIAYVAAAIGSIRPLALLICTWTFAWPAVLATMLIAGATRRRRWAAVGIYAGAGTLLGVAGMLLNAGFTLGQLLILWMVSNLPPTLLLSLFLNRRVRAVGPLVLAFVTTAGTGSALAIAAAERNEAVLRLLANVGVSLGLNAVGTLLAVVVVGFIVFAGLGWLLAIWIRRRYEAKQMSDLSVTLDAMWLLFAVYLSVLLVFEGIGWMLTGFLAFVIYKVTVRIAFRRLRRARLSDSANARLLLLRVFSLGRRSEQLFDALGRHWRHIGSIQLISGPDLATSTIEPHEFLLFLTGKLGKMFVSSRDDLQERLTHLDEEPDHDGRYRVNDFFCYEDTWRMTLSALAREDTAVLMDVRGFTEQNAGVIFELQALVNLTPLHRIVLVVDDTVDMEFLRRTLQETWSQLRADSPNAGDSRPRMRLARFSSSSTALSGLLRCLCEAVAGPTNA